MAEIKSIQSLAIHSSCSCTSKDTEQEECSSHSISVSQGWDSEKQKDLKNALQMWVHQAKRITQNWAESKSKHTHLILELSVQVSKAKVKHTLSLRFEQLYVLDEETQRVSSSKLSSNRNEKQIWVIPDRECNVGQWTRTILRVKICLCLLFKFTSWSHEWGCK